MSSQTSRPGLSFQVLVACIPHFFIVLDDILSVADPFSFCLCLCVFLMSSRVCRMKGELTGSPHPPQLAEGDLLYDDLPPLYTSYTPSPPHPQPHNSYLAPHSQTLAPQSSMAAPPISHLQPLPTTSPSSSINNLSFPNLADSGALSLASLTLPSPQLGSSSGAIVTTPAAGLSTPPPTATAQFLPMPPAQSAWPSAWPGNGVSGPANPPGNQMLPPQFNYPAPQQPPRLESSFAGMAPHRVLDPATAAFAGPYPASVYQLAPASKMPRKDYRLDNGIPVNKVRGDGRKCRKVYGMENKDKWCTQCRWKKACVRFID